MKTHMYLNKCATAGNVKTSPFIIAVDCVPCRRIIENKRHLNVEATRQGEMWQVLCPQCGQPSEQPPRAGVRIPPCGCFPNGLRVAGAKLTHAADGCTSGRKDPAPEEEEITCGMCLLIQGAKERAEANRRLLQAGEQRGSITDAELQDVCGDLAVVLLALQDRERGVA